MQVLIKTLKGENGELYAVIDGRRVLLAKCNLRVEVYEHSQKVNILGAQGYRVKKHNSALVICAVTETTRDVDVDYLQKISHFEVLGDFQREDGIFERVVFDSLSPVDIDLHGNWVFDVSGPAGIMQRLLIL